MTDRDRALANAARYLGMRSAEDGGEMLLRAYDEALYISEPKFLTRRVKAYTNGDLFMLEGLPPIKSAALSKLFEDSREGLIVLITLGAGADARVAELMESDIAYGVTFNACLGAYADTALDERLRGIAAELKSEGLALMPRVSPGYGDLPLELQAHILALLNADRIGVRLTDGLMMQPEKSITAIIGIADRANNGASLGCDGGAGCRDCPRRGVGCPFGNE